MKTTSTNVIFSGIHMEATLAGRAWAAKSVK
jgi:hypothetical protein